MTNKLDLEESERICEAATPGPWEWREQEYLEDMGPEGVWLEPSIQVEAEAGKQRTLATIHVGCGVDEDAAFISHARTALPQALVELRELRAENERLLKKLRESGIGLAQEY